MKLGVAVVSACLMVSSVLGLGCNRNRQEAVIMANDADKMIALNPAGAATKY